MVTVMSEVLSSPFPKFIQYMVKSNLWILKYRRLKFKSTQEYNVYYAHVYVKVTHSSALNALFLIKYVHICSKVTLAVLYKYFRCDRTVSLKMVNLFVQLL